MIRPPRTLHLEGSRLAPNETDRDAVKLSSLVDQFLVIEEKMDGTSVGISFDEKVCITIQTRAKVANAKQFDLLHTWANDNMNAIWDLVNDRYIMFGEWCYAKHSIFYDNLCHYFLESDIYDKKTNEWLSTSKRHELIHAYADNKICSVPVLKIGRLYDNEINSLITRSFYKSPKWKENLASYCNEREINFDKVMSETDDSDLMEGLYIKSESADNVIGRYKFVRYEFLQTILKSGSHYADRPIIPNMLGKQEG